MVLPNNSGEILRAHHALTGAGVFLEVLQSEANIASLRYLMQQIPPHPSLLMPHHSFENDGKVVFVTSQRQSQKLQDEIVGYKASQEIDNYSPKNWARIFADYVTVANHYERQGHVFTEDLVKSLRIDANNAGFLDLRLLGPKAIDPLKTRTVLAGVARQLLQLTSDALLKEAISSLEAGPEKGSTLESIVARLRLEIDPSTPTHSTRDILSRFTDRSVLRRHKHGETLLAFDSLNKTQVIVKYEEDRDGQSWTDRESRLLNHIYDRVAGFVPRPVASDRSGGMSYLAVASFDGERLSDLIDGGYFTSTAQVAGVIDQLLGILDAMHPDIAEMRKVIDLSGPELSQENAAVIGDLRDQGISHNHICPSNILVGADGQVMLIDFVRAGRMGELAPERSMTLWPSELPSDVCDPRADIYCVAKILEAMLNHVNDSTSDQALISQIEEIAQRVTRLAVTSEFLTAAEFRTALSDVVVLDQVLKLETFQPSDTLLRIKALIAQGDYRGALSICPTDWTETYREIESKIQLAELEGVRLCNIGDVELSYIGKVDVPSGTTSENDPFVNGTAQCYRVNVANRCVLEVRQTTATDVKGITSSWVGVESSIGEVGYLRDVVRSKRMSVLHHNGQAYIQLGQAQIVEKNGGFATSVRLVNLAQLSAPCGEVDALQLLADFGALATDTREILFSETNNKRNYLATSFSEDSLHLAAVAHLITRIIPIYRGPNVQ
jgi:serine/threonine protein kinase